MTRSPTHLIDQRRRRRTALAATVLAGLLVTGCGTTAPLLLQQQVSSAAVGGATGEIGDGSGDATDSAASAAAGSAGVTGSSTSTAESSTTAGTSEAIGGTAGSAGTPAEPGSLAGGTASGTTRGSTTGTATGTAQGTISTGKATAPSTTGSRASRAPTAVKTTAATKKSGAISVGLLYLSGASGAASALGVSGLDTGDSQAQGKAVVDYLNAHGGISGSTITMVPYGIDSTEEIDNETSAQQAACTGLTQDDHVAAVVSYVPLLPGTIDCFAKAATAVIDDASTATDDTVARDPGELFAPGDFFPGRLYTSEVNALFASGWLTKTSHVGIYSFSGADEASTVDNYIKPALQRLGITNITVATEDNSAGGVAQNSSVVLDYTAAGVDRVISAFASPLFLMEVASSQGYHPEYALNSDFGPGALLETAAPKDELAGSAGFGWQPFSDIGAGDKGPNYSSNETLCLQLMSAAGQASTSGTTELLQLQTCDAFFFLHDAAVKGGGVTSAQLQAGAVALGTNWPSAATFASGFAGHLDGASAYRLFAYESNCSCFQYTTPITAVK